MTTFYIKIVCLCIACLLFVLGLNNTSRESSAQVKTKPAISHRDDSVPVDKVAAVQFPPQVGEIGQNQKQLARFIERASAGGARYIVLPELALTGSLADLSKFNGSVPGEPIPGATTDFFAEYSRKFGIWLVFSVIEKVPSENGYYLTTVLLDDEGEIRHRQRKNLPRISGDDGAALVRGNPRTILESYDDGLRRIGVLSGDDIQAGVPRLSNRGASIIFVTANLTSNEAVDWEKTLRNLAVEYRVDLVIANTDSVGARIGGIYSKDGKKHGSPLTSEPKNLLVADLVRPQNEILKPPLGLPAVPLPNTIEINPQLIALGRSMFFDKSLSRNGTVSCASCHQPDLAFSNGRNTGVGISGKQTQRNVPGLLNVAYRGALFWDGYASTLENQSKYPLTHASEMGLHYLDLVDQLRQRPEYVRWFKAVTGVEKIEFEDVSAALASYQRTLLSGNSAFDRYYYAKETDALNIAEKRGLSLFTGKANCVACHQINRKSALFLDQSFHNTGIGYDKQTKIFSDLGLGAISYDGKSGLFFTPTLRNIARTAPYMHDGSIDNLEDVVKFYNHGGNKNPYLDSRIKPLNLSSEEIDDLVKFLHSLDGDSRYDEKGLRLPDNVANQIPSSQSPVSRQIAALQFSPAPGKVDINVSRLIKLIDTVAGQGSQYIVLPEYALTASPSNQKLSSKQARQLAAKAWQAALTRIGPLSRQLGVWLIVPTLEPEPATQRIYSTILVWNDQGNLIHRQRKLLPLKETGDMHISSGQFKYVQSFHTPDGLMGVISGGDLLKGVRRLSELGARTIFISAAWNQTDSLDYLSECRDLSREFKVNLVISNLKTRDGKSVNFGRIMDKTGTIRSRDLVIGNSAVFGTIRTDSGDFEIAVPLGLPPVPYPAYRQISDKSVDLGKELFFDTNLSRDRSISCATCHIPSSGFANNSVVAKGVSGRHGKMNVPSVINSAYRPFLGWEGSASSLEEQITRAMHGFPELDITQEELVARLNLSSKYRQSFQTVTGREVISLRDVVNVLADFQRTLIAGNSAFDRYYYGKQSNALSDKAKKGFELFQTKANCTECHMFNDSYGLFSDFDFHNTGVGYHKRFEYLGYAGDGLEGNPATKNSFRGEYFTPSLRNVEITGPYMHDGSLSTLVAVIKFYNAGGTHNPFLDKRLKPLGLTEEEQDALVEFLNSLTSEKLPQTATNQLAGSH